MKESDVAKVGAAVLYLDQLLNSIEERTRVKPPALLERHTEKAFLETLNLVPPDKRDQVSRRCQRGAAALRTTTVDGDLTLRYITFVRWVSTSQSCGILKFEQGTFVDYLFTNLNSRVDVLVSETIKGATDLDKYMSDIDKIIEEI